MGSARRGIAPSIGAGKGGPIYIETSLPTGDTVKVARCNAAGYMYWNYFELARFRPFDNVEWRLDCNRRLNAIPGVALDERFARDASWPTIRGETLERPESLQMFYAVVDWVAQTITAVPADVVEP